MEGIRLETEIITIKGNIVLKLIGEIDVYTAPQFKEAVNEILKDENLLHLIIDMNMVSYMDSSGFGILLSATKRLKPKGGSVNLIGCSSSIERVLKITKLDTIFACRKGLEETIQAIGANN